MSQEQGSSVKAGSENASVDRRPQKVFLFPLSGLESSSPNQLHRRKTAFLGEARPFMTTVWRQEAKEKKLGH